MSEPVSCAELVKLVTDYFEGALPVPRRLSFEEHIAICPPCRGYLAQMRETLTLVGELTEESLPVDVRDRMLELFRDWKRTEARGGGGSA